MAVDCSTPDDMAEAIKCLGQQSEQALLAQLVYLNAIIAGVDPDPDALMEASRCFQQQSEGVLLGELVYLNCVIANK